MGYKDRHCPNVNCQMAESQDLEGVLQDLDYNTKHGKVI